MTIFWTSPRWATPTTRWICDRQKEWAVIHGGRNSKMNAKPIGSIPFIDGIVHDVFLDADGKQYVFDNDGQPVYGVWIYIDEPEIVERFPLSTDFSTKEECRCLD